MKILAIHSDFLKVEPKKKAIKLAEEAEKAIDVGECLVVFTAVEKADEKNAEGAASRLVEEAEDIAKSVKAEKIVIYPYAHLSSDLGSPEKAIEIIQKAREILNKDGYGDVKVPFGWYKGFEIKCKGHPLSELSRAFTPESARPKKERKEGSEFCKFIIVDKDGKEYEVTPENWEKCKVFSKDSEEYSRLKIFVRNELAKGQKREEVTKPKHIGYMKKLELVDYCPESDVGHFKWFPKGLLIKDLILMFQEKLARDFGAFKISNPLLYRLSVPDIRQLLGEFHEKDYSWRESNDDLILRFASDPGAFPFMQKVLFSHKIMPIKEYEEAICFRKEQKGELSGLRRVRNFTMTDLHAFCKDIPQTKEEYEKLCLICQNLMDKLISKGRWVLGWEAVEAFYEENKPWILGIIKKMQVPSFIKIMKERGHYYSIKNEYQSIEADEGNSQISTVQFDVVNGERFNIGYIGEDGKKHPCMIIHCSTFGSIERTLCSLLENAAIDEKNGKLPMLPLWLSPTQVRVIPVSMEKHAKAAMAIMEELEKSGIRADMDDNVETVSKRIRNAEEDWVPYTLVIGDREAGGDKLMVRVREINEQKAMPMADLIREIRKKTEGMPFKPLPLPSLLSKRPVFFS